MPGGAATVGEALGAATLRLRRGGDDDARLDATLLLSHALDRDAAWLLAHADDPLEPAARSRFATWIARRERGEPVAYLIGSAGFYGRLYAVDERVLVPRPETEDVVDVALAALRARGDATPAVCDVGTGSGAIAIALACEWPGARVTAIDVSEGALDVARANARTLGVAERVRFVRGDNLGASAPERFACIVANLPYVRSADVKPAPDPTSFEPRLALDGGPDGLAAYRALLRVAPAALDAGGTLVMEAGPDTTLALAAAAASAFPGGAVSVSRDLAGRERLVVVRA